jgi:hypothetical protein
MKIPNFHPQIAEDVVAAFVHATAARWSVPRVEIQERVPIVLVYVETHSSGKQAIEPLLRETITHVLNKVVPTHPEHPFGLWMVLFLSSGKVYEVLHPSELFQRTVV